MAPTPPFALEHQLTRELDGPARHVPGHPRVSLEDPNMVWDLLAREICSDDLDRVANRLWWMSKQDNGNISPLHRQLVKRRTILVTEDPKLHLHIRRAALGYLRKYYYLVKHESDLRIAQDPSLCLVPPDITWKQFCDFTSSLGDIADRDVSLRYTYGEIRLTRLNFYAPLLLGKSHFQRVEYQYGPYFARFYGPILFVIAVASVVLSGMQVVISVGDGGGGGWKGAALWISVMAIVSFCSLIFILGLLLVYKVAKEWKFAIRDRLRLLEEKRAVE
ncbi:subtilisin-like serine protease [Fusarium denticulatum]|uniref:Subtilisin-like serine protease n=1 Tax=Fusarium denticulatum TaxID=48507 RepID=A0A8H5TPD4_9HYPO|nr:subtilisin-like serine protease [Fusarium denticulatum]